MYIVGLNTIPIPGLFFLYFLPFVLFFFVIILLVKVAWCFSHLSILSKYSQFFPPMFINMS